MNSPALVAGRRATETHMMKPLMTKKISTPEASQGASRVPYPNRFS